MLELDKMTHELKVQTESIFSLAHEFVGLRERINRKAGTFQSLVRRVNFQELYNDTVELKDKIGNKMANIHNFMSTHEDSLQSHEEYLSHLAEYTKALQEASNILTRKIDLLHQRAQNKNRLRWGEFKAICNEEKLSLQKCQDTGYTLTKLYSKLCKKKNDSSILK